MSLQALRSTRADFCARRNPDVAGALQSAALASDTWLRAAVDRYVGAHAAQPVTCAVARTAGTGIAGALEAGQWLATALEFPAVALVGRGLQCGAGAGRLGPVLAEGVIGWPLARLALVVETVAWGLGCGLGAAVGAVSLPLGWLGGHRACDWCGNGAAWGGLAVGWAVDLVVVMPIFIVLILLRLPAAILRWLVLGSTLASVAPAVAAAAALAGLYAALPTRVEATPLPAGGAA